MMGTQMPVWLLVFASGGVLNWESNEVTECEWEELCGGETGEEAVWQPESCFRWIKIMLSGAKNITFDLIVLKC